MPSLPTSAPTWNERSVGAVLISEITPPDELPYSAENGPRSTSMREAPAMSKCEIEPCPSGVLAGTPSVYRRMPRTPKAERAPKPRELICRSCA